MKRNACVSKEIVGTDQDFFALITARDVLQRQIDERVKLRRRKLLQTNEFYQSRKTRKLAEYVSGLGFRIVSCIGKEQVLDETRAANLMFRIKENAVPIFKRLVSKGSRETEVLLDDYDGTTKNLLFQLCDAFARLGWIKTERTKRTLRIERLNDKAATNFWHGRWAEYVSRSKVIKVLQSFANTRKCRYDVYYDIELARWESTGHPVDMQLDLVALVNDRFYVFDMKTGVLCIDKWVDRARLFSADQCNRFITCCLEESIPQKLFDPYVLIPLGRLEERLLQLLENDSRAGQKDKV